jgi:uncharacterized membrane protein
MQAPKFIQNAVVRIEGDARLDSAATTLCSTAAVVAGPPRGAVLRGEWLGHALHPLLTDLPLGCWISSGLLDLVGGRGARRASQRLVGLGLIFVAPTAASGMAEYELLDRAEARRAGVVHGVGNTIVAALYLQSWRSRRAGHHGRGVLLGLAGGSLAWATGYLGGHLSFARGVGMGARGLGPGSDGSSAATTVEGTADPMTGEGADDDALLDLTEASAFLRVPPAQVEAMVSEGLLAPATASEPAAFRRSELSAVRLVGG